MGHKQYENYEITKNGDVYYMRGDIIRLRRHRLDKKGYPVICITDKGRGYTVKIHHMVALRHLPLRPSPQHEIRHLDGDKTNNHYTNLAWGTAKENAADREAHGRTARCERNGAARLTQSQVDRIRFLKGKVQYGLWSNLARALDIDRRTLYHVLNNDSWKRRLK